MKIKEWQEISGKQLVVHGACIENENNAQHLKIAQFLRDNEIMYRFNLVRYNPYSDAQGKESSKIVSIAKEVDAKIIPRVGKDIYASCGQFHYDT